MGILWTYCACASEGAVWSSWHPYSLGIVKFPPFEKQQVYMINNGGIE